MVTSDPLSIPSERDREREREGEGPIEAEQERERKIRRDPGREKQKKSIPSFFNPFLWIKFNNKLLITVLSQ